MDEQQPNLNNNGGHVKMNVQEFASKYESKREVYNFLAGAVGAYLAGYENVSIYYLRDLVSGQKKCKYWLV